MPVIYQITNMLTGDFYVGSAQSFARREWQHRYSLRKNTHKNPHMQASWNKYGEEAFVFEVLEEVGENDNLLEVENKYLHKVVGQSDCFNVNKDALSPRTGQTLSAESRAQLSRNRVGKHAGAEHYRYGQTVSDEVRAKISATQKGRPSLMKGKKMSEQGRANVAAAAKRGPESHAYGKRPTNADALQRAVTVRFPDGREETFVSLTYIRDNLGVSIATMIRACKSRERIERGKFAGHVAWYADEAPTPVDEVPEQYRDMPRTRTEAKALGAKKYFTGEPCTNGHVAARYTKGQCVVCAADEQRARAKQKKTA
jgi:group I intron endonuclease